MLTADLIQTVLNTCRQKKIRLATVESCAGGLIAASLTDIPGSSDVVDRGFITYSNVSKTDMLGVPPSLIQEQGAVSAEVALAMAEGALKRSPVDLAVSVTGIAGPGGGSPTKPVGLVFIAVQWRNRLSRVEKHLFQGDRASIRQQSVKAAFELILRILA